jgi:tetratricopeptide (TPR) repeat protein
VSARARIWLIVGGIAVLAAAGTAGLVALTRDDAKAVAKAPPLFLDLGVRDDAEARALRRASRLYAQGQRSEAHAVFERYASTEAKVGAAFASWPDTLSRLGDLPQRAAIVRLHEGIALAAAGDERGARRELEAAVRVEPDTPYAVRADDFLHPRLAPGLPVFVPSQPYPDRLSRLSPAAQLAALAHMSSLEDRLRYGAALQRLGRPVSAARVFDLAVRLAPQDPEALTAAAVARFDKDAPVKAFSRLGPLSARFPRAQTVRFHLGLLMLWIGDVPDGKRQLRKARALGAYTPLGKEAKRFLDRL